MSNEPIEILEVLTQIRDLQKEHLEEFRKSAAHSIELQEENKKRAVAIVRIYKRVVVVGGIVVIGCIALLVWLMTILQSLPLPE